jgi:hypothetical protein
MTYFAAGGDFTGSFPNAQLVSTGITPGPYLSANITVDAKGRITAVADSAVTLDPNASVSALTRFVDRTIGQTFNGVAAFPVDSRQEITIPVGGIYLSRIEFGYGSNLGPISIRENGAGINTLGEVIISESQGVVTPSATSIAGSGGSPLTQLARRVDYPNIFLPAGTYQVSYATGDARVQIVGGGITSPGGRNFWIIVFGFSSLATPTSTLIDDGVGPALTLKNVTSSGGISIVTSPSNNLNLLLTTYQYCLIMTRAAAQPIPSGNTPVLFDTTLYQGGGISLPNVQGDVTVPRNGIYEISYNLSVIMQSQAVMFISFDTGSVSCGFDNAVLAQNDSMSGKCIRSLTTGEKFRILLSVSGSGSPQQINPNGTIIPGTSVENEFSVRLIIATP